MSSISPPTLSTSSVISSATSQEPPSAKKPKPSLFDEYCSGEDETASSSTSSLSVQISQYLSMSDDADKDNCLAFWSRNKNMLDKLFVPAVTILSVPASSAPVERVFSYSGIYCKPHRSRMSDENVARLTYLKCNSKLG